ncbi:ferredoxin [Streptomyces sp. NPDC047000]|uniref:ferredoxin n=1 Tax=Streptomyces sp. NPDC047000 TaxID=3155474 RepID=UPI0033CE25C3
MTTSATSPPAPATTRQELVRFLEDRFTCAQACTECAHACAVRAALLDPDVDLLPDQRNGAGRRESVRRRGILCAEVCDATCRLLSEETSRDEHGIRVQVEWCRAVCEETADVFAAVPGAEDAATACRACAQACTDFLTTLR